MKITEIEEEREAAESKRLELEQALEEFVRMTDKKGKLSAIEKKGSSEQGTVTCILNLHILCTASYTCIKGTITCTVGLGAVE